MNKNIIGYVQAPNYVADKQVVKVQKSYVPYTYKCKGIYAIGNDGLLSSEPIRYRA